ncbi:helix-turn-helix domain-containing protein [Helcococcus kunzii]|uniref:helix-turn-helix domain-containing protein n=1 Tax=Helcococcus kunzii TaxID=40091 RepID=UPI0024AE2312|nr:helix-turn-helix transcriptional regulator [Helcococcus kunzii]
MISNKLKHLRTYNKMTMRELAEAMNKTENAKISASMISSWENEKYKPSLSTLQTYSNYFNVKIEYLTNNDIPIDYYPNLELEKEKFDYKNLEEFETEQKNIILSNIKKLNFIGLVRVANYTEDISRISTYQINKTNRLLVNHYKKNKKED